MATQINNTASATYNYGRNIQDSATSNTATTNLITDYAISATKESLNTSFRAGENITYLINVSNDGTSPLYNVLISDDLAGGNSTYLESSSRVIINGVVSDIIPSSINPLSFTLPNPLLGGEEATIIYSARVNSTISDTITELTNTASIQANEGSSTGPVLILSPSPSLTLPLEDFANLTMSKTVSTNEITIGETFSYVITLSNSGNLDATGVVVTDTLPLNFSIFSITSVTNGVLTTYSPTDYTIEPSTNTLTLPSDTSSLSIIVPAATPLGNGTTTITITGAKIA